jgi:hypothetical protein
MHRHEGLRRFAWLAPAALGLLAPGCVQNGEVGGPLPPPPAFVSIDPADSKVDTTTVDLRGRAECDGCPQPTDWQYGQCPAIACPLSGLDVSWSNDALGATGETWHVIGSECFCPVFGYGYCYSSCHHAWSATVPLAVGANSISVRASGPGFAPGTKTVQVGRVPQPPEWLTPQPGIGEVTLAWAGVDGATSYDLYWSATPCAYAALGTRIADVTSPFTHAGLDGGVTYYYFVTALAGDLQSFDSVRLEVIPD